MNKKKILVIVPAYNEEGNIKKVIEELYSIEVDLSVLVVNDASKDATCAKAESTGAFVLSLPFNLGIGGAVQTGFQFAHDNDYDIAVQVDGDGQHNVRYLHQLIEPVVSEKADMVIGSRFLPPHTGYQSSFIRRIGINFFAKLISIISEYKVTDPTSGFRAFNRRLINVFSKYYPHDFPEPEAIMVAGRYNAKVIEIPVEMRKREAGSSSIRYLKTLYYMVKVTFAIFLDKFKERKKV